MENKRRYLSLVVLGDTSVGKTTLIDQYVSRRAVTNSKETKTPSFVMKDLFIEDIPISVQIWDVPGRTEDENGQEIDVLSKVPLKGMDGCVLVFDHSNATSFENLDYWKECIEHGGTASVPFIVVGNKFDSNQSSKNENEVLAWSHRNKIPYHRVDAMKDHDSVSQAFEHLLERVVHKTTQIKSNPSLWSLIPLNVQGKLFQKKRRKHKKQSEAQLKSDSWRRIELAVKHRCAPLLHKIRTTATESPETLATSFLLISLVWFLLFTSTGSTVLGGMLDIAFSPKFIWGMASLGVFCTMLVLWIVTWRMVHESLLMYTNLGASIALSVSIMNLNSLQEQSVMLHEIAASLPPNLLLITQLGSIQPVSPISDKIISVLNSVQFMLVGIRVFLPQFYLNCTMNLYWGSVFTLLAVLLHYLSAQRRLISCKRSLISSWMLGVGLSVTGLSSLLTDSSYSQHMKVVTEASAAVVHLLPNISVYSPLQWITSLHRIVTKNRRAVLVSVLHLIPLIGCTITAVVPVTSWLSLSVAAYSAVTPIWRNMKGKDIWMGPHFSLLSLSISRIISNAVQGEGDMSHDHLTLGFLLCLLWLIIARQVILLTREYKEAFVEAISMHCCALLCGVEIGVSIGIFSCGLNWTNLLVQQLTWIGCCYITTLVHRHFNTRT